MKRMTRILGITVIVAVIVFGGCFDQFVAETTLNFNFGRAENRSILDDENFDNFHFVITLTKGGESMSPVTVSEGQKTVSIPVTPGLWDIEILALLDGESEKTYYEGYHKQLNVIAGRANPVTITMMLINYCTDGHLAPGGFPATCTTAGNTGTGTCERYGCNEFVNGDPLDPPGHDFSGDWQKDDDGHWKACKQFDDCTAISGDGDDESVIASHISNNAQADNCLDPNVCTECNYVMDEAKTNHRGGTPTCTEQAKCTDCSLPYGELDLDNHDESGDDATCTTAKVCARTGCDEVLVPALGHNIAWVSDYTATDQNVCDRTGCTHIAGVGDTGPAGGKIFYVAEDGFTVLGNGSDLDLVEINVGFAEYQAHYLEVAPTNATSDTQVWGSGGSIIRNGLTTYTNATAVNTAIEEGVIGNGRKDTQIIIASTYISETEFAARSASEYKVTPDSDYDDWFLPSITELNFLYASTSPTNYSGMLTNERFWSSSQIDGYYAWTQSFDNGTRGNYSRAGTYSVRAIRAF